MKVAIIKGYRGLEKSYINACTQLKIEFVLIDVFSNEDWISHLKHVHYDAVFVRPPCDSIEAREFYSDIIFTIDNFTNNKVYPAAHTFSYYENKRMLSYRLNDANCRYPYTAVVHTREDFIARCEQIGYPVVLKSIVGSGSAGVVIVKKINDAKRYSRKIFGTHPAFALGVFPKIKLKFGFKVPAFGRAAKHACILQQYLDFKWEWRVVVIGNSLFAYRKLKGKDGFASGSHFFGFGLPPNELVIQCLRDSRALNFLSGALDYFELSDGSFMLNEVQCIFGHESISRDYPDGVMFDDLGQPCIYRLLGEDQWEVVYGSFGQNHCANLRVRHALNMDLFATTL